MERGFENTDPVVLLKESDEPSTVKEALDNLNDYFCSVMTPSSTSPLTLIEDDNWVPSFSVEDVWQS